MNKILKYLLILVGSAVGIFVTLFSIYFFNLDMKLTSAIEPFLIKHYDRMPRNSKV